MKGSAWPAVALALGTLAGVVVLAALHADTSVFLTALAAVIIPVLGALGYGQLAQVREQTNGTQSRLMTMLEESHRMLAAAHVPPSALPALPGGSQDTHPAGEEPGPPETAG